ncbi:hypothetical protein RPPS3_28570 [Rhodopseudomonas palustris]|uniref:HNH endonuclease n=1 Tax=Rhodopseudomonas palustris TaxID=1076 RepID=UPI000D21D2A0|nr:HNH endonuclease [Rhodopseudomonas palustris]AVT76920.1 hypothetical protein RPPS3_28570 [Rhodopseudomonas palustris]
MFKADQMLGDLDQRLTQLATPRTDCLYYAITITAEDDGRIIFGTQSQWAGWANLERREELRQARLVYPKFVELWQHLNQPYAVIHTLEEIELFLLGGGNAIVEENLGRSVFQRLLAAEAVVPHGEAGFASLNLLPKTAFRRAPTPKVRMQVLKRDRRRCRICGRNPDDHLDLVLHVHHIRPWENGGVTDPANLITLCHTCHTGLVPHEDHSLFSYLRSKPEDLIDERLKDLWRGIMNYRKLGFCSA